MNHAHLKGLSIPARIDLLAELAFVWIQCNSAGLDSLEGLGESLVMLHLVAPI
jgi:hypothetical protein